MIERSPDTAMRQGTGFDPSSSGPGIQYARPERFQGTGADEQADVERIDLLQPEQGNSAELEFPSEDGNACSIHHGWSAIAGWTGSAARTKPKPLPAPRGVILVLPSHHHLTREQLTRDYDRDTKTENTTTKVTGDAKFEAAVRRMFEAPDDATVEIIQDYSEYGTG
ncbi:hypothetical protein [Arthrobacter sp. PAMC25284]|uniref:hypothetical protein n=1 Tax=Arthrobacter sp. PAMC25284 TaxID=2861279 RepID=UPI001C626176|nr:hypothetical protein [Arthrobacter sp. PAMC25284]QYF88503.1 hypothetical protein KY499_09400 [Arthrobacter sp. PAMC25284]